MANNKDFDVKKVDEAIKLGIPISVTTYNYSKEVQTKLGELIAYFLNKIDQVHLKDYAIYCLSELAVNAKKANTKRVFFDEQGLDIFDKDQYETGMQSFKKETIENIDYYLERQKDEGLYIKVTVQIAGDSFEIEVRNNAIMTQEEMERIKQKITLSSNMEDISEAVTMIDETEGAGLGLMIMMLMLKQINAGPDAYSIEVVKDETISKIRLPFSADYTNTVDKISSRIIRQINQIPQFPEKILELQKLINNPDTTIPEIAKKISDDVGITTDLLKVVNSVAFGLKVKCSSIPEAVKLVGVRGIQNLLYSIGTMNVFTRNKSTNEHQMLWHHSYKVAYFSYNLARVLRMGDVLDDAYVCGLLHDIGKLVFSGLYPDVLSTIYRVQKENKISQKIIDTVISGINHAEIGALLAEKWNFPPQIISSIRYHHSVDLVEKDFIEITMTVALANYMVHYAEGVLTFDQIPVKILQAFNIENEEMLSKLTNNFSKGFESE
ncbi:MAG: HDOD domain-containing protein [Treponemataceae bacterium]